MIVTDRQKRILQILLENGDGISLAEVGKRLATSRRTLYREFGLLRPELAKSDLTLTNKKGYLQLTGPDESIAGLRVELKESQGQGEMKAEDRGNALAALLLLKDEPEKIIALAGELGVSEATVQTDLDAVAESLAKYQIELKRTKGLGVQVSGRESQRRRILNGILLIESNDYVFFSYLNKEDQAKSGNFFIDLLPKKDLLKCWQAVKDLPPAFNFETDYQLIELILFFAISLGRQRQGKSVESVAAKPDSLKYQGYVYQIFAKLDVPEVTLTQNEVIFLANQLQAHEDQRAPFASDDQEVLVNLRVGQFIQDVSDQVHFDFSKNPAFSRRLQKHISGLLQHSVKRLPNVRIETLSQLTMHFPQLYEAITAAWKLDFSEELNVAELQLLLLYFANEYGSRQPRRNLSALVICDNGLGTSAILAARLQKEVPEIKKVKTARASGLAQLKLEDYDIIFSTLDLPGFPREYHLVSPLLLGGELDRVKSEVASYVAKYPEKNTVQQPRRFKNPAAVLTQLAGESAFCQQLLQQMTLQTIGSRGMDMEAVLSAIVTAVPDEYVKDRLEVAQRLKKRLDLAPLGLPGSHLALLHTRTPAVKKCFFAIYELTEPISMAAMDQSQIMVKRQLLLLAPEDLPEASANVLGMISSFLVMSDQTLRLFEEGNCPEIAAGIAQQYLGQVTQRLNQARGQS
ncbi:BglG family transcription antiterminator [Lactobacillus delbrueckii]|uniref:BglG family transcription antiterminator n=1 Tax=Lactobacillus delbrueckii TaxID=1584 RepID=UPI0022E4957B|nr:HTH domain-containing protein [Lactobacillus delbrueckii]